MVGLLVQGIDNDYYRTDIIEVFAKIAPKNWKDFSDAVGPLVQGIDDTSYRTMIIRALAVAPDHWESFAEVDAHIQENVYRLLGSLRLEDALPLAMYLVKKSELPAQSVLMQKARSVVLEYIMQNLPSPDKYKAYSAVEYTFNHGERLGLIQEDAVFQEAIRVGILLNQSDDPRSPFRVYEDLQKKRKQKVDYTALKPAKEIIAGCSLQLIPESFRKIQEAQITYAELPKYSKTFLQDMSSKLKQRVEKEKDLDKDICKIVGSGFNGLMAGALGGDYLENLLLNDGEQHERVPILVAKFIAIISYIESLSSKRNECLFSEQEEVFLRMLASICLCYIGKAEGINKYYANVLPDKYKLSSYVVFDSDDMPPVIVDTLIGAIENLCTCSTSFMKNLCGIAPKENYPEGSGVHQETYIKNLIGDIMPLNRIIVFDTFTQNILCKPLLALSKQEVMEVMFNKYLRPSQIVSAVRSKVNKALAQEDTTVYMDLQEILEDCIESKDAWNIEDDPITITELGVIHLLEKLGIIEILKARS